VSFLGVTSQVFEQRLFGVIQAHVAHFAKSTPPEQRGSVPESSIAFADCVT
jgi:hypothetical protein